MMREGVGGSIKSITKASILFQPGPWIMAIDGDEDMAFRSPTMDGVSWSLSGITKDSTGAVVGGARVELYYTGNDQPISAVVSDGTTGAFSFKVGIAAGPYYAVAYKAGSPDVAGTTVNTLLPVAT